MPNRFSSSGDYGQTFAYLYDQNQRSMEAAVQRRDAQREADLAAQDALIFTRWQEGKLSGNELMAYINKRLRETYYDKAQQARWREAAITYGSQIADNNAEAAYAESGDINALIGHYASRLGGVKRGTPEYLDITQRLKGLTEQRDSDNLRKQAKRISRAIAAGKMTTQDLIVFYRDQLKTLPSNSPLREQVQDALSEARAKVREENFQIAMQKVDSRLATGSITPTDAANSKQAILEQFDVETRDPTGYWQWQEQVRVLRATPDPAVIAQMETELAAGKITPEQYILKIEEFANRIEPYNMQAAWQLRAEAQKITDDLADPLKNPGALGLPSGAKGSIGIGGGTAPTYSGTIEVVRNLTGNAIKHITQMDGSNFSEANCTMAAAAMLAHSMGYTGLTGADLRYLSGVTTSATNIAQAKQALEATGVDGTRLAWENRIGFEQFKQRLANGAPAVLSGWLGDIPAELNTSGIIGGHAMFAATYDPQRDAFLMLDPAKGSDEGTWWPASIVENFGWGGARDGQALFAPRGTVNPNNLKRAGGKVFHISVDAPPRMASTPPSAGGQFDPGPRVGPKLRDAAARRATREERVRNQRLRDAGIDPGSDEFDTAQEVEAELQRRQDAYNNIRGTIDDWVEQFAENGEDTQDVYIGGVRTPMTRDDLRDMEKELLSLLDGQEIFYDAVGNTAGVQQTRKDKAEIVTIGVGINTIEAQEGMGRLQREAGSMLKDINESNDPYDIEKRVNDLFGIIDQLAGVEDLTYDPLSGKLIDPGPEPDRTKTEVEGQQQDIESKVGPEIAAAQGLWAQATFIVRNTSITRDERIEQLFALGEQYGVAFPSGFPDGDIKQFSGNEQGRLLANMLQVADEQILLNTPDPDTGEALGAHMIVNGELVVVPTRATNRPDPATGRPIPSREPVLDYLPDHILKTLADRGYDAKSLPIVIVPGRGGTLEHRFIIPDYVAYSGIEFLVWNKTLTKEQRAQIPAEVRDMWNDSETPLTEQQLGNSYFTADNIRYMDNKGWIEPRPFMVERITLTTRDGRQRNWYRDEGTTMWHLDNLPFMGRAGDGLDKAIWQHPYTGATINERGDAWPQLETDSESIDFTNTGVPVPYMVGIKPERAGQKVVELEAAGWLLDSLKRRSIDDPTLIYTITPGDDDFRDRYDYGMTSLPDQIQQQLDARKAAMDKLISTQPELAAETPMMTENEKRQYAAANNINYDTGEWIRDIPGVIDESPSAKLLKEAGIELAPDVMQGKVIPTYDPVSEALRRAQGVAAANKAALIKSQATAASGAVTSVSTLPKVTTPDTFKAPVGSTTYDPLSSARITQPRPQTPTASTQSVGSALPPQGTLAKPAPATPTPFRQGGQTYNPTPQPTTQSTRSTAAPYMYGNS